MVQKVMGVVKKDMIRSAPPCRIDGMAGAASPATDSSPQHSGREQARIVEQKNGLAVVEVTCSCGKKMYLNCEYAG